MIKKMKFAQRPKVPMNKMLNIPRALARRREWFNELPDNLKRVAVAQDAIAQIKADKYLITPGTYFGLVKSETPTERGNKIVKEWEFEDKKPLISLMGDKGVQCEVCARGGVFASMCRMTGEGTASEADNFHPLESETTAKLFPYYTMLEAMFEQWDPNKRWIENGPGTKEEKQALIDWLESSEELTAEERMIVLMENIIRNDGDLVICGVNIKKQDA